jgi:hypothetical protein
LVPFLQLIFQFVQNNKNKNRTQVVVGNTLHMTNLRSCSKSGRNKLGMKYTVPIRPTHHTIKINLHTEKLNFENCTIERSSQFPFIVNINSKSILSLHLGPQLYTKCTTQGHDETIMKWTTQIQIHN